jgi:hypothetical protein
MVTLCSEPKFIVLYTSSHLFAQNVFNVGHPVEAEMYSLGYVGGPLPL